MSTNKDFDFYFGNWVVRVQRLKDAFVGSEEWLEYTATDESRSILGGMGCIDNFVTAFDGGRVGMALRLFNPATKLWSIYWADSRSGVMDAPVVGAFNDQGEGEFFGDDVWQGRPIRVRNIWRDITPESCFWEQACSLDGGASWEANCRMWMRRVQTSS